MVICILCSCCSYKYAEVDAPAGQKRDRHMVLQNPRNQQCPYKIASTSKDSKTCPQHHFFTLHYYLWLCISGASEDFISSSACTLPHQFPPNKKTIPSDNLPKKQNSPTVSLLHSSLLPLTLHQRRVRGPYVLKRLHPTVAWFSPKRQRRQNFPIASLLHSSLFTIHLPEGHCFPCRVSHVESQATPSKIEIALPSS